MSNRPFAVLTRDGRILFGTRMARTFGYGFLSVVLVLYLAALGLDPAAIGLLLTLTLAGDAAISLWLTTHADRIGRQRVLLVGALLMGLAGVVFAATEIYPVLVIAATIGIISPSGNEVGPFLAVEQAALSQTIPDSERTRVFGWFNLVGSFATAGGALVGGAAASFLASGAFGQVSLGQVDAYRAVIVAYAVVALALAALVTRVSLAVEVRDAPDLTVARRLGLHRSQRVVARLSALFALDAFGGGFVVRA
jgi:MFS family permease